uniref:Tryptophan synthase alpha chain n=1 Tax=Osmundaria fimbriata TaxID=228265 RepID=A0A1Z1M4N9_OSMFI|nr:Tryptophan synthase alpha subunit [Osmundaria fimbriata]ARW60765.1 Tryptophan synthase alpha subunit [Osmundaria fimbriata]
MNLISQILQKKRDNSTCALIPFITAGYPSIDMTVQALYVLEREGADIIELGIPYSDALADGPIIQESSKIALQGGAYMNKVLLILDTVKSKLKVPIVIFSYYNPILVRGTEKFLQEVYFLNVKGLVIPDLPIEETDYLIFLCKRYNIELILFIAPTSSEERISKILLKAPGCVYLVSSTGVTGIRKHIGNEIDSLSKYIKSKTNNLIMLGFGIASPDQVSKISRWNIDGVVVGSAFINVLSKSYNESYEDTLSDLGGLCSSMKSAICS